MLQSRRERLGEKALGQPIRAIPYTLREDPRREKVRMDTPVARFMKSRMEMALPSLAIPYRDIALEHLANEVMEQLEPRFPQSKTEKQDSKRPIP